MFMLWMVVTGLLGCATPEVEHVTPPTPSPEPPPALPGPVRDVPEVCEPHRFGKACGKVLPDNPDNKCSDDDDCDGGYCVTVSSDPWGMDNVRCACRRDACIRDEDCPNNEVCACMERHLYWDCGTGWFNICMPGDCRTSEDCDAGQQCVGSRNGPDQIGITGFFCTTPDDACRSDQDCDSDQLCAYLQAGTPSWRCADWMGSSCE